MQTKMKTDKGQSSAPHWPWLCVWRAGRAAQGRAGQAGESVPVRDVPARICSTRRHRLTSIIILQLSMSFEMWFSTYCQSVIEFWIMWNVKDASAGSLYPHNTSCNMLSLLKRFLLQQMQYCLTNNVFLNKKVKPKQNKTQTKKT